MKNWDYFYPDVLQRIDRLIPNPVVDHHLKRAAQQFCTITRAWVIDADPIDIDALSQAYDIGLDKDKELVRIESALLDGSPISVSQHDQCRHIFTRDGQEIHLSWTPSGNQSLALTISISPSNVAKGIDDVIAARYCKAIADGAVASINNDATQQQAFMDSCNSIAVRVWRGLSSTRPRAKAMFL